MPAVLTDGSPLSFDATLTELQTYVQGLENYKSYQDFISSGAGETFMEQLAGIRAGTSYRIDNARKEAYLDTSKLTTSAYLIASMLNYVITRKTAPKIKLRMNVVTQYTANRLVRLGTIGGHSISVQADNTVIAAGAATEIECVIGDWTQYDITSNFSGEFINLILGSTDYKVASNVDSNGNLEFVTFGGGTAAGTPITVVELVEEMLNPTTAVLVTEYDGDVRFKFGDGILGYAPQSGHQLIITLLETPGNVLDSMDFIANPPASEISNITGFDTIVAGDITFAGAQEEAVKKIKSIAPRFYTALARGVTLVDCDALTQRYSLLQDTQVRETVGKKCEMDVAYLQVNETGEPALNADTNTTLTKAVGATKAYLENTTTSPFGVLLDGQRFGIEDTTTTANAGTYTVYNVVSTSKVEVVEDFNTNESFGASTKLNLANHFTEGVGSEMQSFRDEYEKKHKIAGTKVNMVGPVRKTVEFKMTVVHEDSAVTATIQAAIEAAIDAATLQLGKSFYIGQLMKTWNAISGVVAVYLEYPYEDRALGFGEYFKKVMPLSITFTKDEAVLRQYKSDVDANDPGYN